MELMGSYLTIKPGRNETSNGSYFDGESSRNYYNRRDKHVDHYRNDENDYYEYRDSNQYKGKYQGKQNHYNQYSNERSLNYSPRMEQYPSRILIPSDMVKVVLGKAGATITAMQTKTNTKIDVHRDKGPVRGRQQEDTLVTIRGEPDAFSEAIKEILTVIQSEYEKRDHEDSKPLQLKLLAHDLLCGRIIGKAGTNLKKVRQESGVTKLIISNSIYEEGHQFMPSELMGTGERVITVEGSVDAICIAEEAISKKLRDYMEKDNKHSGNTFAAHSNMNAYYGRMGGYLVHPQQSMYNKPHLSYGYPNSMAFMGYPAYPGYMGAGYPGILGHGYPPFLANFSPQPQGSGEIETTCVIIPTKEVGAIIGRNGDYISRCKGYSGAQVRVVKGEEGGESRVEITGPADAQWRAALCVFSKIKETMKLPYSEAQLKTEFMVPGACVGRIIGKKGSVVQDIQEKSQADIEVPKDKQGGEDVPVFITGTFNGTQIALNRIRDIINRAQIKNADHADHEDNA